LVAGEAQIIRIAVAGKLQGRGLGNLLVSDMIERAMSQGALAVSLEVRESNIPARKVYERNGFVESGIRPNSALADSTRGGSIMAIRPRKLSSFSSERLTAGASTFRQAKASTRRPRKLGLPR